jgi:hypothetical protein
VGGLGVGGLLSFLFLELRIMADLAKFAPGTFRIGRDACIVGQLLKQLEELDPAILGDSSLNDGAEGGQIGIDDS